MVGSLLEFHFVYEKKKYIFKGRESPKLLSVCVISWATKNTPSFDVVAGRFSLLKFHFVITTNSIGIAGYGRESKKQTDFLIAYRRR